MSTFRVIIVDSNKITFKNSQKVSRKKLESLEVTFKILYSLGDSSITRKWFY